jgi:hypothetical protein
LGVLLTVLAHILVVNAVRFLVKLKKEPNKVQVGEHVLAGQSDQGPGTETPEVVCAGHFTEGMVLRDPVQRVTFRVQTLMVLNHAQVYIAKQRHQLSH